MKISFVSDIKSPLRDPRIKHEADLDFDRLCRLFEERVKRFNGEKSASKMFLMAEAKPFNQCKLRAWDKLPSRCKDNFLFATALTLDIDNQAGMPVIDPIQLVRTFPVWALKDRKKTPIAVQAVAASSASSRKQYPKGRVVIPLTRGVTPDELFKIMTVILDRIIAKHPELVKDGATAVDTVCRNVSQPYYLPQSPDVNRVPADEAYPFFHVSHGAVVDPDALLASFTKAELKRFEPKPVVAGPVDTSDFNLKRIAHALKALNPGDHFDRHRSSVAMWQAFGDRAWPYWCAWYQGYEGWTMDKLNHYVKFAPECEDRISLGYIVNRARPLLEAERKAREKKQREEYEAKIRAMNGGNALPQAFFQRWDNERQRYV